MVWPEVAERTIEGMGGAIGAREVTYDFERQMREDAKPVKLLKCSEFGLTIVKHLG